MTLIQGIAIAVLVIIATGGLTIIRLIGRKEEKEYIERITNGKKDTY